MDAMTISQGIGDTFPMAHYNSDLKEGHVIQIGSGKAFCEYIERENLILNEFKVITYESGCIVARYTTKDPKEMEREDAALLLKEFPGATHVPHRDDRIVNHIYTTKDITNFITHYKRNMISTLDKFSLTYTNDQIAVHYTKVTEFERTQTLVWEHFPSAAFIEGHTDLKYSFIGPIEAVDRQLSVVSTFGTIVEFDIIIVDHKFKQLKYYTQGLDYDEVPSTFLSDAYETPRIPIQRMTADSNGFLEKLENIERNGIGKLEVGSDKIVVDYSTRPTIADEDEPEPTSLLEVLSKKDIQGQRDTLVGDATAGLKSHITKYWMGRDFPIPHFELHLVSLRNREMASDHYARIMGFLLIQFRKDPYFKDIHLSLRPSDWTFGIRFE